MLHIEALHAGYGTGTVIEAVTLHAGSGTVHAVVGHNGAGKTTLIHTIAGLIRPTRGSIRLDGQDITTWSTHRRARAGIALVPQGRRVWPSLTVAEHLTIATGKPHRGGQGWNTARVLDLLPQLAARLRHRGSQLSGGEQQMLAIARALLTQPRVLLADEPTEGLAPTLAGQVRDLLAPVAAAGTAILLATPTPELAHIADRVTILTGGRTTPATDSAGRLDHDQLRAALTPGPATRTAPASAPVRAAREPPWAGLLHEPEPANPTPTSTGDTRD